MTSMKLLNNQLLSILVRVLTCVRSKLDTFFCNVMGRRGAELAKEGEGEPSEEKEEKNEEKGEQDNNPDPQ